MRMFGQQDVSAFDTMDHDKHRQRREPWNPYFSKQSVARLQPLLVQAVVDKRCVRLREYEEVGKPVVVTHAFACVTSDIISEYSFPEGYDLLEKPEFDSAHYEAWMGLTKLSHVLKQFGWLYPLLDSMPMWITKWTSPEMYLILQGQKFLLAQAIELSKQRGQPDYKETTSRTSMMKAFMDSPLLPESEKAPSRIKAEAQIAIDAGTLTTTHALKAGTYHILANPDVHSRLMAELEERIPDPNKPPNLRELEQMPYLQAVMQKHSALPMVPPIDFRGSFPTAPCNTKTLPSRQVHPYPCRNCTSTTMNAFSPTTTNSTQAAGKDLTRPSSTL